MRPRPLVVAALALICLLPASILAQRGQPQPPRTGRAGAPFDLTGYWVALVTNEWRWRMLTPPKGEYDVIPLNAEGRRVADTWDPARDEASGNQCRGYGAAIIMQVPGRLHVQWEGENVLRMDTDAGMQTRRFHFGASTPPSGQPTWQGYSVAQWQPAAGRGREIHAQPAPIGTGTLKVVTTRMRPGYLRKNGVPYGSQATVTEYLTPFTDPRGNTYINVTVAVQDPQYLADTYIRSMQFRKEPDGSKWSPEPCSAR